jgi:hypothetical protein
VPRIDARLRRALREMSNCYCHPGRLVLLVVGYTDETIVSRHRGLQKYDLAALRLLKAAIEPFEELLVTPNALTETSNILRQIRDPDKKRIAAVFKAFIQRSKETYVSSSRASSRTEFLRLGLSDAVLLEVAKDDIFFLTVDGALYAAALAAGYDAVNFNHIRDQNYSS